MKANETPRREVMQQMGLLAGALCLFPLASCDNPSKEGGIDATTTNAPIPFLVPQKTPLEVGPLGSNKNIDSQCVQTNTQFSCVEAVLAPKKIAGSPHKHDNLDELMYVLEGTIFIPPQLFCLIPLNQFDLV